MKHCFAVFVFGLCVCTLVLADGLTDEYLRGKWGVYWTRVYKSDHYLPLAGGGDTVTFHSDNRMIYSDARKTAAPTVYRYCLDAAAQEIQIYRATGEFVFRWRYEQLTPDILVASRWCPACQGEQESDELTIFVRAK